MFGRRRNRNADLAAVIAALKDVIAETRETYEAGAAHALRVPPVHRQVDLKPEDAGPLEDAMADSARAHVVALQMDSDPAEYQKWLKRGTHREIRAERTGDGRVPPHTG